MSGLLKRSAAYRHRQLLEDNVKPSELLATDDSGISAEDRSEILQEIEHLTSEQRKGLSPDALVIARAAKRGFVFPLVVNLAMVVLLAGGLFGLYSVFQQQEQQMVAEDRGAVAAQSELIRRIQEQAQAQLEQKEQEIANIQERLGEIEQRRATLESNLEEELARREAELRAELEAELAAERERLQESGATEETIERRIAAAEEEGNREIQAELAELRAEAQAERQELDESLARLQGEYRDQLQELEAEREEILAEAREREEELRSGFQEEIAESEEQLAGARAELEALSQRRERERLAANQIVGYYNEIRAHIRDDAYGRAMQAIEQLRSYLSEDTVASLPAVARRREAELFILSSLEQLVENQQTARATDTDALIARAQTVQEATRLVNEGTAALEDGNTEEAEQLYSEAIELIPAVARSHEYFVSQQQAVIDELQSEDADLAQAADEAVEQAQASFAAAEYGAALAAYQQALSLLPQDVASAEEVVSQIRSSGVALADQQAVAQQSAAAEAPFQAAQQALSEGRYTQALDGFMQVAAEYPRSRQMEQVPDIVRTAVADRTNALESRLETMREEAVALENRVEELSDTSTERAEEIAALERRNEELNTRVEELSAELEATNERLDSALAELETARGEAAAARTALTEARQAAEEAQRAEAEREQAEPEEQPALTPEIREELENLREIEQQYTALREEYVEYARQEDQILGSGTDAARLQTKLLLDSFLASRPVREAMPGIRDRIKAYDRAFEEAGRETALLDTVDVVYELSTYEGTARKLEFLDAQRAQTSDPNMIAFLDELEVLISQEL